jgi:hypothetical protein
VEIREGHGGACPFSLGRTAVVALDANLSIRLRWAEILYVAVGTEPRVVGQVPTIVVGIFIHYDLIGTPVPISAETVVSGSDPEGKSAEPEAIAVAAFDAPDVACAEAAREAPMFPGMIEMITGIVAAGVVADPGIVGVNVRGFGVAALVGVFRGFLWCGVLLRPSRWRAVSGNMAVPDVASLWRTSVLRASVRFFLGQSGNGADQKHCKYAEK